MLTPDRIRERTFQTTGRGSYRSDDVDAFMFEVSASYEQIFKENADLVKKISILAQKVEEYRADEEALKMALFKAQKLADNIVAEAKETAANEVASVKGETDALRAEAARDAAALEENAKNESEAMLSKAKNESEAMVSKAKSESEAMVAKATADAEKIVKDANDQAAEILGNINRKVTHESLVYEMVQKEASEFKSKLVAMYKEHINLINQLPEIVDEKLDKEEAEEKATVVEEPAPEVVPVVEETVDVQPEETVAEEKVEIVEPAVEAVEPVTVFEEAPAFEEPVYVEEAPVFEEPAPTPAPEKKAFTIDLSKIDFADDEDDVTVAAPSLFDNFTYVTDDTPEDEDDDAESMSFRNFFKKK